MNINQKLHIISILPVVMALTAVLIVTQVQYQSLSEQAVNVFRENVIKRKKEELTNYVAVASGAIKHVYHDKSLSKEQAQGLVKEILADMRFGLDGYFFAYHYDGTSLVLPGQEWRVGQKWLELEDQNGVRIIGELIKQAKQGGGYLHYVFNQPSKGGAVSKKIAYAEGLDDWQWMFGTGVYIDDIDEQTARLSDSISEHISKTSLMTLLIGTLAVFAVFWGGLFIRFGERRLANQQLRALNERIFQTQEEERKRVSRELHDGISQTVAATRFSLETAQLKQEMGQDGSGDLDKAIMLIRQTMQDIRSISHQLHPGILEDYGLGAALNELGSEFSQRTNIKVTVQRLSVRKILSTELSSALYRIAQESLTNIERHSSASHVMLSLNLTPKWLTLETHDDGQGFDYEEFDRRAKPHEGIGLRNMKERLQFYKGKLKIRSTCGEGMTLIAQIPQSELKYYGDDFNEA